MQGPQISELQRSRVLDLIEKGKADGAQVVLGGGRPAHLEKGWFVEPTLFAGVENWMSIAQQEIFGPVLAAIPYDDEEDAIAIANDSKYGLSGGVYTSDIERGMKLAQRIRTGSFNINSGIWYGADSPYGGYKTSGIGRQNGIEGFEQHLETKAIAWPA